MKCENEGHYIIDDYTIEGSGSPVCGKCGSL